MDRQAIKEQNKSRLRQIMTDMPDRSGYAAKVVNLLAEQGVTVTLAMVYQTAHGRSYNLPIIDAIVTVYESILKSEQKVNQRLMTITND